MSTSAIKRAKRVRARQEILTELVVASHTPSVANIGRGIVSARNSITAVGAAVQHPLGPPTVSGTDITVDQMMNQPTRVTRMLMDLTLKRFLADRIFASAGGVTGGAVIY